MPIVSMPGPPFGKPLFTFARKGAHITLEIRPLSRQERGRTAVVMRAVIQTSDIPSMVEKAGTCILNEPSVITMPSVRRLVGRALRGATTSATRLDLAHSQG